MIVPINSLPLTLVVELTFVLICLLDEKLQTVEVWQRLRMRGIERK